MQLSRTVTSSLRSTSTSWRVKVVLVPPAQMVPMERLVRTARWAALVRPTATPQVVLELAVPGPLAVATLTVVAVVLVLTTELAWPALWAVSSPALAALAVLLPVMAMAVAAVMVWLVARAKQAMPARPIPRSAAMFPASLLGRSVRRVTAAALVLVLAVAVAGPRPKSATQPRIPAAVVAVAVAALLVVSQVLAVARVASPSDSMSRVELRL